MKPTLVVLAAGMGSRYGGLKQIDPFGPSGETIIDYSVYDAVKAGFGKVVFVIRESLKEDFQKLYFNKFSTLIEVDFVFQEADKIPEGIDLKSKREKPWGTGHAVLVAKEKVNEPFAVINADDFYGKESFDLMAEHLRGLDKDKLHGCMVGFSLEKTISEHGYVSRGVCDVDKNNDLISITERTHISKKADAKLYFEEKNELHLLENDQTVSMNLMGFTPVVFELMTKHFVEFLKNNEGNPKAEFYIPYVLDQVRKLVSVPVMKSNETWLGVTYKEDKEVVTKKLKELSQKGLYPSPLWDNK